jgi:hypothetical protein
MEIILHTPAALEYRVPDDLGECGWHAARLNIPARLF